MKKNYLLIVLRFCLFLIVFAIAFFLILFVVNKDPGSDLQMFFIKIPILAAVASLFYILLFKSDQKIVD
jgi:hypothetical protein